MVFVQVDKIKVAMTMNNNGNDLAAMQVVIRSAK